MKILFAVLRHVIVKEYIQGGDKTINDLIVKTLIESGNIVIEKSYPPFDFWLFLRRFTIGLLYNLDKEYDLIICDSNVSFYFNSPKTINIFHYSYYGYWKYVARYFFKINDNCMFLFYSVLQFFGSMGKHNIAVSLFMKSVLLDQGIHVDGIIENCLDVDIFKPINVKKNRVELVYAGGFCYHGKGFDILEGIADKGYQIDCYTNYQKKHRGMKYFRPVPHLHIPKILNKYTILLYPSRFESFGMVPLEAMACGIPVIMGNVGMGRKLIKDIPEFVVEMDVKDCVQNYIYSINIILKRYNYYSQKARKYAKDNYGLEHYRLSWNNLVNDL